MSSDIPGFYYDAIQQRYYRITSQSSNAIPSARAINDRAQQEQRIAKQFDLINSPLKKNSQRYNEKKRLIKSRLSLLRQREYGQTSIRKFNFNKNLFKKKSNYFFQNFVIIQYVQILLKIFLRILFLIIHHHFLSKIILHPIQIMK